MYTLRISNIRNKEYLVLFSQFSNYPARTWSPLCFAKSLDTETLPFRPVYLHYSPLGSSIRNCIFFRLKVASVRALASPNRAKKRNKVGIVQCGQAQSMIFRGPERPGETNKEKKKKKTKTNGRSGHQQKYAHKRPETVRSKFELGRNGCGRTEEWVICGMNDRVSGFRWVSDFSDFQKHTWELAEDQN